MININIDYCEGSPERFREVFGDLGSVEKYFDGYFEMLKVGAWFTLRDARNLSCLLKAFDDEIKSDRKNYNRAWRYCECLFAWFVRCLAEGRVADGDVRDIALILDSL